MRIARTCWPTGKMRLFFHPGLEYSSQQGELEKYVPLICVMRISSSE